MKCSSGPAPKHASSVESASVEQSVEFSESRVRTGFSGGGSRIRTVSLPSDRSGSGFRRCGARGCEIRHSEKRLRCKWDQQFESSLLQQRVCKLSVPHESSADRSRARPPASRQGGGTESSNLLCSLLQQRVCELSVPGCPGNHINSKLRGSNSTTRAGNVSRICYSAS
jgi:hypothetical protein